jgi:hypothetical protein
MSVHEQHSNTGLARSGRTLGAAAVILMSAALGACTAPQPANPAASAATVVSVPLAGDDAELDAGTYLFEGFSIPAEVTVPEGWSWVNDAVLRKDVGDTEGVFVWLGHASHVPADACQWPGTLIEVGTSVGAFADALQTQTYTTTTDVRDVSVGDFSGVEFGVAVEGVADLDDCSGAKICIHSESASCTRWYNSSVGQRETYRVLDLDGERVILTVGEFDDKTQPALLAEAQGVLDSVAFVSE